MNRFPFHCLLPLSCASLLISGPGIAGQKDAERVPFEQYAKGYFVKNTAKLPGNPAFLVLNDKNSYDRIFGIGFVMGQKPKLVNEALFEKHMIVAVIKSSNTLWKYEVEQVRVEKKRVIVQYKALGKESASAKFTVPLIVSVPRGDYTDAVFIENGKEVGRHTLRK